MSRAFQFCAMTLGAMFTMMAPAMAQEDAVTPLISLSGSLGAGIIMLGAGFGIAKIGAAAVESMARQPDASNDIRGAMIVAAALIEGATFFGLIVCLVVG